MQGEMRSYHSKKEFMHSSSAFYKSEDIWYHKNEQKMDNCGLLKFLHRNTGFKLFEFRQNR